MCIKMCSTRNHLSGSYGLAIRCISKISIQGYKGTFLFLFYFFSKFLSYEFILYVFRVLGMFVLRFSLNQKLKEEEEVGLKIMNKFKQIQQLYSLLQKQQGKEEDH